MEFTRDREREKKLLQLQQVIQKCCGHLSPEMKETKEGMKRKLYFSNEKKKENKFM